MSIFLFAFAIFLQTSATLHSNEAQRSYAQCQGCKLFSESFEKGMRRTSKGNFGGGDSSWEEKNLGSYENSEVRLVEIQENICDEVEDDDERSYCQSFSENYEQDVEDWWHNKQEKFPNMYKYLCVQKLKLCRCKPGYREHEGLCIDVDECSIPHKHNCKEDQYCFNIKGGYICNECDLACATCHSSGPDGCKECAPGFKLIKGICLSEMEESQNQLFFILGFWIVFMGMYFLKKSCAFFVAIIGVGFCIYISFPDYFFQLLTKFRGDKIIG